MRSQWNEQPLILYSPSLKIKGPSLDGAVMAIVQERTSCERRIRSIKIFNELTLDRELEVYHLLSSERPVSDDLIL